MNHSHPSQIGQDTDFYRGRTEWIEKLKQLVDEMQTGGMKWMFCVEFLFRIFAI